MRRILCFAFLFSLVLSLAVHAAEKTWDLNEMAVDQPPTNCFSTVAGEGKPGTWKIAMDELPLALQPFNTNAPKTSRQNVIAQVARDYTDNHFPMLVLGNSGYDDFTFKTKFKIVDGLTEQSAGVVFRMQDEKNFYMIRVDATANKLAFMGMGKGVLHTLYSQDWTIAKGVWHDLSVGCEGSKIIVAVDGQPMNVVSDPTYAAGKIALCTKSDTIAYFADSRVTYTPREPFVQELVRKLMQDYPRLEGVSIFMVPPHEKELRLVASDKQSEIGGPAEKTDADVIDQGVVRVRKDNEIFYVTMPLRDRNGDPVAAVRIAMKSFKGQTEENALARATPMIKEIQKKASMAESLF